MLEGIGKWICCDGQNRKRLTGGGLVLERDRDQLVMSRAAAAERLASDDQRQLSWCWCGSLLGATRGTLIALRSSCNSKALTMTLALRSSRTVVAKIDYLLLLTSFLAEV